MKEDRNRMTSTMKPKRSVSLNYLNGKIYEVTNTVNDKKYIGSTTQTLSKRLYEHKSKALTSLSLWSREMKSIGRDNFSIHLIELFPCTCRVELEAREYAIINMFDKDKLFNEKINGKNSQDTRDKISASVTAHLTGKFETQSRNFQRGSIRNNEKGQCYQFTWCDKGKPIARSFCYARIRSSQMAYLMCIQLRDKMYPLTNKECFKELPFCDE